MRPLTQTRNNRGSIKNPEQILGFVRLKGVEPPRLAALDPKSSMSTNSITAAMVLLSGTVNAQIGVANIHIVL